MAAPISRTRKEIYKLIGETFADVIKQDGMLDTPAEKILADEDSEFKTPTEVEFAKDWIREMLAYMDSLGK